MPTQIRREKGEIPKKVIFSAETKEFASRVCKGLDYSVLDEGFLFCTDSCISLRADKDIRCWFQGNTE